MSKKQERHLLHTPGLDQRQRLEHLVQRAKPAGKNANRRGAHQKMHLADSEVVKIETQFRRDIGIWRLFMWQHDIQANRPPAGILRATIAGLHDAGASSGHDDIIGAAVLHRLFCHHPGKAPRFVIVF